MRLLNISVASILLAVSVITLLTVIRVAHHLDDKSQDDNAILYSFCSSQVYYSTMADGSIIHSDKFDQYISNNQLQGKDLLIMYIPAYSCESCVRAIIKTINEYISVKNNKNVLFIVADSQVDYPEIGDNCVKIINGIEIGIDSIQLPVVFIYNEHVKHLLIPDVGLKIALQTWLEAVTERYSLLQ